MTKEEAIQYLEDLEIHCRFMYQDECGADGIYLSDGVYVDALDYAIMQGDLTAKQEKMFEKAIGVLYPESKEYND